MDQDDILTERIEENKIAVSSIIGTRKYQQDAVRVPEGEYDEKHFICVLSDGMGGLQGGEIASQITVDTFYRDFYENPAIDNYSAFLQSEIDKADCLVSELQNEDGSPMDAGATLLAVIIDASNLYWASVGDSRIYILRGDSILQINEEHNYAYTLRRQVEAGTISLEEAEQDASKDALISYIGMGGVSLIDINEIPFPLEDNDILLLCSDGLFRVLNDEAIQLIIQEFFYNIPLAAQMLTTCAMENSAGPQDNTTVVVIKYNK